MSLIPVDEAVGRLLAGVEPTGAQQVAIGESGGRTLAETLVARRTQPPFTASAMDGYAVRSAEAAAGARLRVVGQSRAGERFPGAMQAGETVRIFTGAPVPEAADAILIQEQARPDGDLGAIEVLEPVAPGLFIRPEGLDFRAGDALLQAGRVLEGRAIALAAAMGYGEIPVRRRPVVAILSNGDELVPPGAATGPDQIVSSNGVGLSAFVTECGGTPLELGIAPDRRDAIGRDIDRAAGADVLVVIGGASVGDHDLVKNALADRGMALDFWRIAMRPGKPLMVGRLGPMRVLGLPGNPVSALVCGHLFLKPLLFALLGRQAAAQVITAKLGAEMPPNDNRQDYVRARLERRGGDLFATPFDKQDSSMLATLSASDALVIRQIAAPAAAVGDEVDIVML